MTPTPEDHEAAAWKLAIEIYAFASWRPEGAFIRETVPLIAAALAEAVREARKIAGCVTCAKHTALICGPCAAAEKAEAVRVAVDAEREACAQDMRVALSALQLAEADLAQRCYRDKAHDHPTLRLLQRTIPALQEAHDRVIRPEAQATPAPAPEAHDFHDVDSDGWCRQHYCRAFDCPPLRGLSPETKERG